MIGFSNWSVVCYDSDLQVMWTTQLLTNDLERRGHFEVKAMAMTVSSHRCSQRDRGSVFVGINKEHRHIKHQSVISLLHVNLFVFGACKQFIEF